MNIQQEKFNKKVKNILQTSETFETVASEAIQEYTVTSSYLQQFFIPKSPSYNVSLAVPETALEFFYVNANLVPISTLPCGWLLKNWADIPGRDLSPERNVSVPNTADDTKASSEIQDANISFGTAERKQDSDSTIQEANETPKSSTVDDKTEPSQYQENSNSSRGPHSHTTDPDRHFADRTEHLLASDKSIKLTNAREPSPDMFADYESSADNSFSDGNIYRKLGIEFPITLKSFTPSTDVLPNDRSNNAENVIASASFSKKAIDLHSVSSTNILECEHLSESEGKKNEKFGHVLILRFLSESTNEKSPILLSSVQHKEKGNVPLNSDDSNQGKISNEVFRSVSKFNDFFRLCDDR